MSNRTEGQKKKMVKISNFSGGFKHKRDVVKEDNNAMVVGSQNVVVVDGEKIGIRPGYSILGSADSSVGGITGGDNWKTHRGVEIPWRSTSTEFQVYVGTLEGREFNDWQVIKNGLTDASFRFASWWDSNEVQDLGLFVAGDSNIYLFSGGMTTFASATTTTITKEGSGTWAESGFITTGSYTKNIVIDGTTYSYTGGEGTDTLTGVTPDPTAGGHSAGDFIHQEVQTVSNKPASGFNNDFIGVLNNQLYVCDRRRRDVYISQNSDFTNFTLSSPRQPGEGALVTLDETPTAIVTLDNQIAISTRNRWYVVKFELSNDNTKEFVTVDLLKNSPLEGATNDLAVTRMKNYVISISNEPTIDELGNVENIDTPQNVNISDPIKNAMDVYGVDEASAFYHKNSYYAAVKQDASDGGNNIILSRNIATGAWESPFTIPASSLFEYNGELYAHSSVSPETYKLLDGYTDNGLPVTARYFSPHMNFGYSYRKKQFDIMWVDGYITAGSKVDVKLIYDFGEEVKSFTIDGNNNEVTITPAGGGLGTYSLGTRNLGGGATSIGAGGLLRFRGYINVPTRTFYELQTSFQSNGIGFQWEIVGYGFNVSVTNKRDNKMKFNN